MGLLSSLFGCSNHHWGDPIKKRQRRMIQSRRSPKLTLQRKVKIRCQHEGCDATKTQWKQVGKVQLEDLDELAREPSYI